MKITYRGECEELYGQEIEVPDHECSDHLQHREHEWQETHGLDCGPYERCYEEWYECTICGEQLTPKELDLLLERQEQATE
jgi:hypothetical protein